MKIKPFAAAAVMLSLLVVASAQTTREGAAEQKMTITRSGTRTPSKGPEANFTGNVSVEPLFPVNSPSRTSGGSVTFEPGARSAWHSHPLGQTLIVTAGTGWVQQEGGEKQEIRAGDVVWTPPGVKHWHGATATDRLTHIAIQETLNGKNVEWMEKVSDEQYRQPVASARVNTRVFEIRTYTIAQKMDVYMPFFVNTTLELFRKYGFEPVGFWIPQDPPRSENTLVYILTFPDRETAKAKWEAFFKDPKWVKDRADFITKYVTITSKIESQFVSPVDFSPLK
jgi:quercetin dioxygenase-like cupin family protein